jgi:hypothetical protein
MKYPIYMSLSYNFHDFQYKDDFGSGDLRYNCPLSCEKSARLATSRPWGREGAGKGTRDPSDEVASGRLVSLAGI